MAGWLLVLLVVLAFLGVIVLAVLAHAGYFADLRIRTSVPASLPKRAAYNVHQGPYNKLCGPLSALTARAPKQTLFCIFYDDPKEVKYLHVDLYIMSGAQLRANMSKPCPSHLLHKQLLRNVPLGMIFMTPINPPKTNNSPLKQWKLSMKALTPRCVLGVDRSMS